VISVIPYAFDPGRSGAYIDFLYDLYRDDAGWIPPDRSLLEARFDRRFEFYRRSGNLHQHFIAMDGGRVVGHASALTNRDLKGPDGAPIGAIGLFECIDDHTVAARLLNAAVDWLDEAGPFPRIWGPVDFDIWRGYRFMTRGFSHRPFPGEPYNKPYYPSLFEAFGFSVCRRWCSVEVIGQSELEKLRAPFEIPYRRCLDDGFSYRPIDLRLASDLETLHALTVRCIEEFVGYTPLALTDMGEMVMAREGSFEPQLIWLCQDQDGRAVAFSICYPETSAASPEHGMKAIFYLIGVVPERRHSGLGQATFYNAVRHMIDAGYATVTIALLAEDSPARAWVGSHGADMEQAVKEYALYEFVS
jgi:GNAT superfamily N-acetyltransferase